MTQLNPGPAGGDAGAGNDLYTTLIVIATAFVFIAAIFAIVRTISLYGSLLPPAGG